MASRRPNVEYVDPATLVPHPDNPRRGDVEAVRRSIREQGWWGVVVAQASTRRILAGHTRTAAAVAEGMTKVPVYWLDVDDEMARRVLLADNRLADVAGYDLVQLAKLLEELGEPAWQPMGWSTAEVEALLNTLAAPPTADELADEVGDPREDDFWPVVRVKVPPALHARWKSHAAAFDDEAAAFAALLGEE